MRGIYANAGGSSDFTGVLVRRQYKPGQKYMQLLFKTADGVKLSISRNPKLVESLDEGRTYHIEGQEYKVGDKVLIHEPTATLVQNKLFSKKHFIIAGIVILLVISGMIYALLPTKQSSAANNGQTKNTSYSQPEQSTTTDTAPAADTTQQPGPSAQNLPASNSTVNSGTGTKKPAGTTSNPPASQGSNASSGYNPVSPPAAPPPTDTGQTAGSPPSDPPADTTPAPTPGPAPAPDPGTTDPTQTTQ
jgi:hypothetical protein